MSRPGMSAIDTHVGRQIRSRRQELRLSAATLGELSGCSEIDARLIESGDIRPGADLLVKLAQNLEVKLAYFFDGFG